MYMSRAPVFIRNPEFRLCYAQTLLSQDSFRLRQMDLSDTPLATHSANHLSNQTQSEVFKICSEI